MATDMVDFANQVMGGPPTPDSLARFVALDHERRAVEDRLDAIKKEQAALQESLLDEWADRGQKSANVDGLTVYATTDVYCAKAAGVSGRDLADVLIANGLGDIVGYNANSLKAWVKETLRAAQEEDRNATIETAISEEIRQLVRFTEETRLRTRLA